MNKLILFFARQLIPVKKILGYVLSAVIGAAALVAGIKATDLKDEVCSREPVVITLPEKVEAK